MMTNCQSMLISMFAFFTLLFPGVLVASDTEPGISNINEINIPEYQAAAIAKEGAIIDTLVAGDSLWILTNKILWKWTYLDRKVQKITLIQKSEAERLVSLGYDGLNLYVSFTSGVYQFAIKQGKVFKYPFPNAMPIKNAEFYGQGDSFWMVANDQINKIDRYGKTISPVARIPAGSSAAIAGFDTENQVFWYANKNSLYKWSMTPNQKPEKILQLKQMIRSVVAKNEGVIVTTSQTVLISDGSGKRIQTIPVEKSRKIVSSSNSEELHAYLFNDRILETFDLKTQSVGRYLLPIDSVAKIKGLKVGAGLIYLIADGKIRLFALAATSNTSK